MTKRISLRALATELGLAKTTVSDALRGKGRVNAETVERIRQAAKRSGYRANPLTSSVLGEMGRRRTGGVRGTIAAIDLKEPEHWPHGPFPAALVEGARHRASEMGFSIEVFVAGPGAIPMRSLDRILQARGIHGVMVLPTWFQPDISDLDWTRYAGIYTDYVTSKPALHSVCSDHYGNMLELLQRLFDRGYRAIGLVLESNRSQRIQLRQEAAFRAFQEGGLPLRKVPILMTPKKPPRAEFTQWLLQNRPDVVLSHYPEQRRWILDTPEAAQTGFVLLNIMEQPPGDTCACLDLQPGVIGARAAEMLVGQILRNERGIPDWPSRTTVEARWIEGASVRDK